MRRPVSFPAWLWRCRALLYPARGGRNRRRMIRQTTVRNGIAGQARSDVQPTLSIAIAGAGPAGLAAARYLHRAGHRITIFERFENPAPVGSGLILQPT